MPTNSDALALTSYLDDLNPTELAWGDIKERVGECLSHSMEEKNNCASNFFLNIQPKNRENAVNMYIKDY